MLGISSAAWSTPTKAQSASPEKYYNEALAEKEKGDFPAASLALRRALVLDPTLAVAQQELKEVLSKMELPMESSWQRELASRYAPEKITFIGTVIGWSTTAALIIIFFLQILPSTKDFSQNSTSDANCGVAPVLASSSINDTLSRCAPEAPSTSSPEASFKRSLKKPKRWWLFFSVLFLCLVGHAISVLGVIIDPRLHARYEVVLLPKADAKAALEHRPDRPATTPLRATPADAASVLAQLPTGSCLILLSQHGAWSYVRTAAGQEGWIASSNLEFLIPKN